MIIPTAHRLQQIREYYFSVKLKEIRQMRDQGFDIINMGIGSPDLPPADATIEALHSSAQQPQHHGYQSYQGIPELRRAIGAFYQQTYGVELSSDKEVLPLMGSKEGITHTSLTFLNQGDEVLVPELGYPAYTAVSRMLEASVRTYPLQTTDWQPDLEVMRQQDYSRVKLMWVNYPHMPTGAPADPHVLLGLIKLAREREFLICFDNPYSLVLNRSRPFSILTLPGAKAVCLEFNSLSKSHNMAGWRVGWIAGAQEYLQEIIKIKSNVDSGMFRGIQDAAVRALQASPEWHQTRNQEYTRRRDIVFSLMDQLGCAYSKEQEGLFVWAKLPNTELSAENFVDSILHKCHVFLTPGFIFGAKGKRYIRASLCNSRSTLEDALSRISHAQ